VFLEFVLRKNFNFLNICINVTSSVSKKRYDVSFGIFWFIALIISFLFIEY